MLSLRSINYRKVLEIENEASLPSHIIIERAVHICRSAVRHHQVAKELVHVEVLMQCVVDCTKQDGTQLSKHSDAADR